MGWPGEYPDYHSQGKTPAELKENLKAIYDDFNVGEIQRVRGCGKIVV